MSLLRVPQLAMLLAHTYHTLTACSEADLDACGGKGRWSLWEPQ